MYDLLLSLWLRRVATLEHLNYSFWSSLCRQIVVIPYCLSDTLFLWLLCLPFLWTLANSPHLFRLRSPYGITGLGVNWATVELFGHVIHLLPNCQSCNVCSRTASLGKWMPNENIPELTSRFVLLECSVMNLLTCFASSYKFKSVAEPKLRTKTWNGD